jgi:hypothetical protein
MPSSPEAATIASQDTAKPEKAPAESEGRQTLADLLREPPPESQEPEKAEGAAPEKASKATPPKGLADLAERLGVKPDAVYQVEVPIAEGESLSIGKLKDAYQEHGKLTERELRFEETRLQREGELLRASQELRDLVAMLPTESLKPEVMQKIRERQAVTLRRERELTLEAIPEWRDEAARVDEIAGMVEHLKGYGFPANYLEHVADHRTLRYIRENWRREQRVKRALDGVQKAPPPATAASRPAGPARPPGASRSNRKSSTQRERLQALLDN